ncbi:uncharacterized protein NECHADRAFT_96471 [Fusarium vanettenii 77-13-4]|uniref:Uncharacterized protein n=1 Tax=Fusarium vanettenii (strain ATCC MYA-4622 / CBS 123669 / FGSC 9596 / NRRL 45880 / 77-13-4) TaxID=660122 RepID=C7YVB6_FUSV7|nr:uncharacterized protein NECHADRAFT_96471 [Fusarium vanettenii 77-13-4]EEU44556.1 hypothetical protein NECHADRAFT_96471 [Fusarium vanettenii 77-13-4]
MSASRVEIIPLRPYAGSKSNTDSRSSVPCRFFLSSRCLKGAACPFSHDKKPTTQSPSIPAASRDIDQDRDEVDDFCRTIAGAFVRFEDGGRVSSISLPNDFSAVHLSGLPKGTSSQAIKRLLDKLGFDVPEKNIWVMSQDGRLGANIRAEDPAFSKKLCALTSGGFTWGTSRIQATRVAARMPSRQTIGRLDCKKVHISWHKPVRDVLLKFGQRDIAARVHRKFTTGAYKILGCKVKAQAPYENPAAIFRSHSPVPWMMRLTDVPGSADKPEISQAISLHADKPREIVPHVPGYSIDDEQAAAMVRSLLTRIGPIEYWETTLESTAKRVKATARFLDEKGARDAASQLNGTALPFHKPGKLTVQMVYSVKFKIRSDIYAAILPRVNSQASAWREKYVYFRAYPTSSTFKLEGESDTEVASSKSVLEGLLGGVVAKRGQSDLWDPSLKQNGHLWRLIKQQQQDLGVVVVRDKTKNVLRLFGTEKACSKAEGHLASLFTKEASSDHVIQLDPEKRLWALKGECSVCWTEADSPVRVKCGHVYCQDCFENSCAALSTSGFLCHGDEGRCEQAVSLQDLHAHLSSVAFEGLLERSFMSTVQRTPHKLRFCPTPDCGYIYRTTESAGTHTCSNCLQRTCSSCHEPHVEMTCAEYKDIKSGGYAAFEKLKKEVGIKDCPECKTPLEKISGCNHITCVGCKAHMCWVCMMTFSSGELVYNHMDKMHGGHVEWR